MAQDPMTLLERLRNPAWIHSHVSVAATADLDTDQTVADLNLAATEIERLRAALKRVLADIAEYERVNNLAPNPGRQYCWDSVAEAHAALDTATMIT